MALFLWDVSIIQLLHVLVFFSDSVIYLASGQVNATLKMCHAACLFHVYIKNQQQSDTETERERTCSVKKGGERRNRTKKGGWVGIRLTYSVLALNRGQ